MEVQELVAQVTSVPSSGIMAKVKRMGGGFGSKEGKAAQLAYILAEAVKKVGRTVRCMVNRDDDMYVFLFYLQFCDYDYK